MRDTATIKAYHRRKLAAHLIGITAILVYAAAWMGPAGPTVEHLAAMVSSRWLGLLIFALLFFAGYEALTLPLDYYRGFVLEHRFDLSDETRRHWLSQTAMGWLVGAILGGILVAGLYALLWYAGTRWWFWTWAGWVLLSVLLVQLFPLIILPIFYPSRPVDDAELCDRIVSLASGTGITIQGVFSLDMSDETKKANAMLAGLGATRRVLLSDTLLKAFSLPQIEVVFAHELGHHVRRHIWKGLAISAVASTAMIGAVAWRLDPFAGNAPELWPQAVAAFPTVVLAVTVVQLLIQPAWNAVSRGFERQCDTDALVRTANPQAYREAFEKLGEMNLADPTPHRIVELLFHDHPALAKRLALADTHEREQARDPAVT